jgi:hypothetical protein
MWRRLLSAGRSAYRWWRASARCKASAGATRKKAPAPRLVSLSVVARHLVAVCVPDVGTALLARRDPGKRPRRALRRGAHPGAALLAECGAVPAVVRPADLGLPYAVFVDVHGFKHLYRAHDDLSPALRA